MFDQDCEDEDFDLENQIEISIEDYIRIKEGSEEGVWNVYENYASFDDPEEIEDY
jgi:hypothetical protein